MLRSYALSAAPQWTLTHTHTQICPEIDMNYNLSVYECKNKQLVVCHREN